MEEKRILVIKLDGIGDFALALPALRGLSEAQPGVCIDVVISSFNQGWRELVPWIRDFHVVDFGGYRQERRRRASKFGLLLQLLRLTRKLRRQRYDAAIDLRMVPGDWRGKLVAWLSGAPARIGGPGSGAWALTRVSQETFVHQSEKLAERLRLICPGLQLVGSGLVSIERTAPRRDRPRILLHPGAGNAAKRWPVAYWIELVRRLAGRVSAFDLQLLGGAEDEARLREIGTAATLGADQIHVSTNLRETMQALADADLLVGLDSAAPHLAFLVGTPAVTIFSAANDVNRWKALGDNTVLVTSIECSPCELPCCKWETHRCMESISPADVLRAIEQKLSARQF